MNQDRARVEDAVATRRERVNEALVEQLPVQRPRRLYEASRYLLDAGGKRLRPAVVLLAAESVADVEPLSTDYRAFPARAPAPTAAGTGDTGTGDAGMGDASTDDAETGDASTDDAETGDAGTDDAETGDAGTGDAGTDDAQIEVDVMSAAVAIEVVQSFTLIHDDIMDDDDLRRGVPAVHREFDLSTAILAGDTLYAKAFEFLLATEAPPDRAVRALEELATTCTEICEGQAFDIEFENRGDVTLDEYLEMVELKTGVLYAASASIPATLLGADDATVEALHAYGTDVGRAFQIQDDVLDLTTPSEKLGKQRGSDLVEDKRTLITVHARDQGVNVDDLVDADTPEGLGDDEVEAAVARLDAAGSIDYARDTAHDLVERGKAHLGVLPDNEARRLLEDVADYLVEREY